MTNFEQWKKEKLAEYEKIPRYFDRKGKPIGLMNWAEKFEDNEYTIVKQDYVDRYFVSTVWLGLNHSLCFFKDAPIQIFETMIFLKDPQEDEDDPLLSFQERYSTEEDAIKGHEIALKIARGELSSEGYISR